MIMETRIKLDNRLTRLFEQKKEHLLNIYFTAGFPGPDDTRAVLKALQEGGADMVEIGMPFSDPLADGPTIQDSNEIALKNGMSLKKLFHQLEGMREEIHIPILLMGYVNQVMQYGVTEFCRKAVSLGVDGVILPDLPLAEYEELYKETFESNNLAFIFLVTPQTSLDRLKMFDEISNGFIYVVSTDSTTGSSKSVKDAAPYLGKIKDLALKTPSLVGFNIKDNETFEFACKYTNGAIIGSAFIKMIKDSNDLSSDVKKFVHSVKGTKL